MSWQNEARSRSANAVFHKHKDLVAQSAEGNSSLEGAAAPAPSSYILQQPMHMAVHMPPVPMAVHNPGQLPSQMMPVNMAPQMLPLPMYTVGQMGAMSAPGAFEGEIVQKNALPMKVDGYYNLEPILYQNIMDSDYFRSLAKLVTYTPYRHVVFPMTRIAGSTTLWRSSKRRWSTASRIWQGR
jgi:hypothetical protein